MKPNFIAFSPTLFGWPPRRPLGRQRRLFEGPEVRLFLVIAGFGFRFRRFRRRGYPVGRIIFFVLDGLLRSRLGAFRAVETVRRLIKSLFGHPEGVHRGGHAAVEDHLGNYLRDLHTGNANMQRPRDVPFDHLRAVSQDDQGRDGAEAAGLQVHGRPVVDLAVDNRVNQAHYFGRQFGHGGRRHRIIVRTVVALPKIQGSLVQVFSALF
jgi:hypothetical protein